MKKENTNPLLTAIRAAQGKDSVPAMSLVRRTDLASAISKLVKPMREPMRDRNGNRMTEAPDMISLSEISNNKIDDINDADTVMQLLPDNELGAQILVSSILSPKDMGETTLNYIPPTDVVPGKTASALVTVVKDYFKDGYKIESKLQEWLRAILFERGSYPIAVIPENSLDEIITSGQRFSMEAISKVYDEKTENMVPLGLLGKPDSYDESEGKNIRHFKQRKGLGFSLEQYGNHEVKPDDSSVLIGMESLNSQGEPIKDKFELYDPCISVTDNPAVLSISVLKERLRAEKIKSLVGVNSGITDGYGFSNESHLNLNDDDIEAMLYRNIQYKAAPVLSIKTSAQAYRESAGEPLILHIPSEAIIPVYIPGSPSQHVGYYVIIDENGFPISKESNIDHYRELSNMTAMGKRSMASAVLQRTDRMFNGTDPSSIAKHKRMEIAVSTYSQMVEKDLISRLRNGIYGQSVKIGSTTEIYRIMFSRSLMQQHTQVLFLPAELMTYMAFKYDDDGVGVSLLDNLKIINSLRTALLLAGVRASVMNSIPRTKVNVKLDPNDPNPIKRREQFVHEYRMLRQSGNNGMPMGTTNPSVIEAWANQAGVEFGWSGHPDIPDMEVDISEYSSSIAQPDTDLREQMDKAGVMGLGLSPEVVDGSKGADFATTIVHNNLLMARRIGQYQEAFNPQLADHVRKVTLNSPKLREEMLNIIMNDFDDIMTYLKPDFKEMNISDAAKYRLSNKILTTFMNKLNVALPKPNSLPLRTKLEAFEEYLSSLDKAMDFVLSSEVLPEGVIGELNNAIDMAKGVVKGHMAREWMSKNDFMSELLEILTTDESGKPIMNLWEIQAQHSESMAKALASFIDAVKNLKRTGDQYMQDNDQDDLDSGSSDYSSDDSSSSDDDFGGDDFGGGMDFEDDFGDDTTEETSEEPSGEPTSVDNSDLDGEGDF